MKGLLITLISMISISIIYVYDPHSFIIALFLMAIITILVILQPKPHKPMTPESKQDETRAKFLKNCG